jgi:hypothetical protein
MEIKEMNKAKYITMVMALGTALLFLPPSISTLGSIFLCCLFVVLCSYLKIRSISASILPIAVLSIVVPTIVLILMGIPIYNSYYSSAAHVVKGLSVSGWFSMAVPLLLSVVTYFLVRLIKNKVA